MIQWDYAGYFLYGSVWVHTWVHTDHQGEIIKMVMGYQYREHNGSWYWRVDLGKDPYAWTKEAPSGFDPHVVGRDLGIELEKCA